MGCGTVGAAGTMAGAGATVAVQDEDEGGPASSGDATWAGGIGVDDEVGWVTTGGVPDVDGIGRTAER